MKTLQNIYIRGKALITREQNRQLEQFHKRMFNEHSGTHGTTGASAAHASGKFFQQRSRQVMRPFQTLFSATILNAAARYAIIYKPFAQSVISDNSFYNGLSQSIDSDLHKSGIVISSENNYTGLLEIFNEPPSGKKQFCGRTIELDFYHIVEYMFPFTWIHSRDSQSVHSEIIEDSDYEDDFLNENRLRIHRAADNLMNISLVKSEIEMSVTDEDEHLVYSSDYQEQKGHQKQ